jgi:hypothetical protein
MLNTIDGLMRDNLRTQNLIPLTSPYDVALGARFTRVAEAIPAQTTAAILAVGAGTSNAIVDWVVVEVRNSLAPYTIIRTIAGLIQRDGDVINPNNGLPLSIEITHGSYMIAIKHRNHLGAMTATPVTINGIPAIIDFTTMTSAQVFNNAGFDGTEMTTITGKRALWLGNCNADNKTKYDGAATDRTKVSSEVLGFAGNVTGSYVYNNAIGYFSGDVNMDGKVKYDGISNDRLIIQQTVQTYPLNTTLSNNYNNMLEQLP